MANQYLHPNSVNLPPQGGFRFLPKVEVFTNLDSNDLQIDLNTWFINQNITPNYLVIEKVDFSTSTRAGGTQYSALVHYTAVIPT